MKKKRKSEIGIINPDAAGIDIGSEVHYVCVPEGRAEQFIRKFGCFTEDLHKLARWLKACGIKTVAMESTGVYWIPLFQVLETQGFEVKLVNAKHVKNVPGRKTDVQDCQWLQQLHSYGLLQGSFRPEDKVCVLRSYLRQRDNLVKSTTMHIQRMQKALIQMNMQLHKVISDITTATGLRIIKEILDGERNSEKLASLKDHRTKNDIATIAKALKGDWREEHLFSLKQEYELYEIYQTKIAECDKKIAEYYSNFETKSVEAVKKKLQNNPAHFSLRQELYRLSGVDFTKVPGFDVLTIQTIISEVGLNPLKWATEKHFTSWLGLSPANKITGEKIKSSRTRKINNRASNAFRLAALAASRSKTALGGYCRRLRNRLGAPKAITACARKLACIFYNLLKYGQAYVEKGLDHYEKIYEERVIKNLSKKAKEFGFVLMKKDTLAMEVS